MIDNDNEEKDQELDSPGPRKYIKAALIALLQLALFALFAWIYLTCQSP